MKQEIRFYFAIFLRRLHYFLLVFGIVAIASVTLAKLLPPNYQATARLLVESPQIPGNLAESTVNTAPVEQLQIMQQRLMTRANLLDIARKFNAFDEIAAMSADEIVGAMNRATTINRSSGRGQATLMSISFESSKAAVTASVVNEYVTLLLRDNQQLRTGKATDTLEFFEQEVQRLDDELAKQSQRIIAFKNANSDALPEGLSYRMNQQNVLQERLASFANEIEGLKEQRQRMIEIFEATGRVLSAQPKNLPPEQQRLAQLQEELNRALVIYSPENPKIKILQAQVASLEAEMGAQAATGSEDTLLDLQLVSIDTRIDQLEERTSATEAQLNKLNQSIEKTPEISIIQDGMNRDYSNIQMQYNSAVSRLATASMGERIEVMAKGQRITVVESATVPSKPSSPDRPKIVINGIALGAAMGGGLVFLLEFLNRAIRRPRDIIHHLGITPIATVPFVRTPMELVMRRAVFAGLFAIVVIGVPAVLFAVHTYYLPLDLIVDSVVDRLRTLI